MKTLSIDLLEAIREDLEELESGDMITIEDELGEPAYVIMPVAVNESDDAGGPFVNVITPNDLPKLSYDEYEKIKDQLLKILEATIKPDPSQLN